jgi:HK97 family phage prohead protease
VKLNPLLSRSVPLIDIEINRSGDGRTVTAYAATFDQGYDVRDNLYPHPYVEEIDPKAFNRTLKNGAAQRAQVIFNHGMTLDGTPSDRFSLPLGVPLEIRAEPQGLLTVTRYSKTPLGDEVLQLIADGAIRAQSFRGPIYRSAPPRLTDGKTVIRRLEIGLTEYGPAPFAVNHGAAILAVRSTLLDEIREMSPDELRALRDLIETTGLAPEGTPDPESTPDAPPADPSAPATTGPLLNIIEAEQAQRRRRTNQE